MPFIKLLDSLTENSCPRMKRNFTTDYGAVQQVGDPIKRDQLYINNSKRNEP